MNRLLYILFIYFGFTNLWAQTQIDNYQFSEQIKRKIEQDTLSWKHQIGATEYSMSEYYLKALQEWDQNGFGLQKLTREDSLYFQGFSPIDARAYIIDRSKTEQIIIVNEAHHNIRHRVFTTSLLKGLYANGYRFLGLEALSDPQINERQFVVQESGYYTQEPQMANLINEALNIGFTVFGYEAAQGKNGKQREIEQAQNIAKMVQENPKAKFLIHCGWDHVIEGTPGDKSWEKAMAGRLKEFTQIDPFTIDQTSYTERSETSISSPYIQLANCKESVIMLDEQKRAFSGDPKKQRTDVRIIHPLTQYKYNRPTWLNCYGERKYLKVAVPKNAYPVLAMAFHLGTYHKNGIPVDVIEILKKAEPHELVLPPGDYEIVLKNKQNKVFHTYKTKVKQLR